MLPLMLQITERLTAGEQHDDQLVLPFDRRQKSRLRVTLASGTEAALFLQRGTVLRGGDRLRGDDGQIVLIVAADEPVMRVSAETTHALMRATYHLGNRHVPLQIGEGWLLPEAGAYGGGHRHHHDD